MSFWTQSGRLDGLSPSPLEPGEFLKPFWYGPRVLRGISIASGRIALELELTLTGRLCRLRCTLLCDGLAGSRTPENDHYL